MHDEPINHLSRWEYFWQAFAVGVGLRGLVWTLFLGWLLDHAFLAILWQPVRSGNGAPEQEPTQKD
jgi:hypothetical protein